MLKHLIFLFSFFLCVFAVEGIGPKTQGTRVFAEEAVKQKQSPHDKIGEAQRDPTRIPREVEAQMEVVEPPELRVTGIMEVKNKAVAVIELNLEDFEGTVMVERGMNVSLPKPQQEQLESGRWMTYFTVSEISETGLVIVLENGEKVWFPVMGESDYQ